MKILLYGINYAPVLTGIGKYSAELAEWLAARGHQVSVVTAPPYYPHHDAVNSIDCALYAILFDAAHPEAGQAHE